MTLRSSIILLLRLGISAGLLIFLIRTVDVDFDSLWPDDSTAVAWLVLALACMIASAAFAAFRWQQVCRALDVTVATPRLFWHTLAGLFFSNFVPTTIGGDVVRVRRLSKDTGDSANSFTTVIFERLSGWMVLPGSIFLGLLLDSRLRGLGAATRASMIAAIVTLVALALILVAAGNNLSGRLLERYEEPLRWLHSVHEGLDVLRTRPRQIVRILGSAAVYQGLVVFAFWAASRSIGIEGFGWRAALAFVPAVLIVQVLPLGIGGLGVREGALVLFLGELGVPDEQAVALGLTIYAITLVTSLLGLPSLVFGGRGDEPADDQPPSTVSAH